MGRAISFNIGQLCSYDWAKAQASALLGVPERSAAVTVSAAMVSGGFATAFSVPMENLKTVQQAEPGQRLARSLSTVARHGIFRGFLPLYLKVGPHTFVVFCVLEAIRGLRQRSVQ